MGSRSTSRLGIALAHTVAFVAIASLSGCLVTSSSKVEETGMRVSENTMAQVQTGHTTGDWLLATLGQPTLRTTVADRPSQEIWRYDHVRKERSAGAVFLIFGGASTRTESSRVYFELDQGVVQRTWQEA